MKKLFIIIIILATAGFFYFMPDTSPTVENNAPAVNGNSSFRPDPSSATFIFDDETITLSKGRHVSDSASEETALLENPAYGDLNTDGENDVVVFLARSGGGSGVFIYAAAYVSGPVNYKGSNAVFLGDRVSPQSISIKNGIATVSYLDREEDEPYAAEPTIMVSKQFIYRNGEFQER
ncbi:MAG: hypothetical protein Q7S54_00495 [bacterium]|nr:hypothetical protein [bacterium]